MDETHRRNSQTAHRGESTIDEIYRQARQLAGRQAPQLAGRQAPQRAETGMVGPHSAGGESAHRPNVIAPGIASFAVRTPTLPPATHTSCYVIGDRELVLVDPASPFEDEQQALDRQLDEWAAQGRVVVSIWLTHHHGDHVGDARRLADRLGVPVAAHEVTAQLLAGHVRVDRTLRDGDGLHLAGEPRCSLRAVFTPGHAPGHLCFLEEQSGALVAGDMVAGVGTILIEPTQGNMSQYLASLARMKALAPSMLLPAHGPVIEDPAAKIDAYVTHRLWREGRVVDALERLGAATASALLPVAYADVPPMTYPMAELSLISHLVKLVEDGRAERAGDVWRLRPAA